MRTCQLLTQPIIRSSCLLLFRVFRPRRRQECLMHKYSYQLITVSLSIPLSTSCRTKYLCGIWSYSSLRSSSVVMGGSDMARSSTVHQSTHNPNGSGPIILDGLEPRLPAA